MNHKSILTSYLIAAVVILIAATPVSAQLIQLDFNNENGDPSLVNRGSVDFTATFTNKDGTATPVYSETVAPPNSGGRSAEFTWPIGNGTEPARQVVDAGNISQLNNLTSLTFTGWVNGAASTGSPQFIVDWRDLDSGAGVYLYKSDGGNLNAGTGGSSNISFGNPSAISLNEWVFLALTVDLTATSGNVLLYLGRYDAVEGDYILNDPIGRSLTQASTGVSSSPLYFGNSPIADRNWAGYLDNLRIYGSTEGNSGVLSKAQLQEVMQINDIPEPSALALFSICIGAWLFRRGYARRRALGNIPA